MFKSQESDRNKWGLWIFWMKLQNALIEIVYRRIRKISKVLKNKSWLGHFLSGEILILLCVDHDHFCKAHYRPKPETFKELKYFAYTQVPNVACLLYSRTQKLNCTEKFSKMKSVRLSFQPFFGLPMVSIFAKPVFHMMMHAKAKPKDTIKNLKSLSSATLILNIQNLSHFLYWSNLWFIDLVVQQLTAMS